MRCSAMSWQAFCWQRQLEMARTDWVAGVFGFALRALSFVKSSRQQHSLSTKVEHAVYSVLALVSNSPPKQCIGYLLRKQAGLPQLLNLQLLGLPCKRATLPARQGSCLVPGSIIPC